MRFECQQLCKTYSGSDLTVSVLENVSFTAEAGEFLCIVGPSGCGKTTLLRLIAELSEPTSGQVCFEKAQNSGHPRSAMVFQEHGLFLWMTVLDNVAFGLEMQGVAKAERHERARAFIAQVGLADFVPGPGPIIWQDCTTAPGSGRESSPSSGARRPMTTGADVTVRAGGN